VVASFLSEDGKQHNASVRENSVVVLGGDITHAATQTKTTSSGHGSHRRASASASASAAPAAEAALFTSAHYSSCPSHSLRLSSPLISCYRTLLRGRR